MAAFFALVFSVIVFCVFIGIFLRLGRIEKVLIKMALHQGAISGPEKSKSFAQRFDEAPL